jgi:hypothetical protein
MTSYRDDYLECQKDLLKKMSDLTKYGKQYFEKNNIKYKSVNTHGIKIIKLKYEDECKFTQKWQWACRGSTIMIEETGDIMPFFNVNKFFNSHEIEKHYGYDFKKMAEIMETQGYKFLFMPKYDGTNVQCFTDKFNSKHRLTLGSLDKNPIGKTTITYDELTETIFKKSYPKLYAYLDKNPNVSVVCELLSPHNVIKTKYSFTESGIIRPLLLIGADGIPTWNQLELLCDDFYIEKCGDNNSTIPVNSWKFTSNNYNEVKDYAFNAMVNDVEQYGENPEGVVAYAYNNSECFPIAKFKRSEYFEYISPSERFGEYQNLKIKGQLDDHVMDKIYIEHIDKFDKYLEMIGDKFEKLDFLKSFLSQKDFAKNVSQLEKELSIYSSSLFAIRKRGFEFKNGLSLVIELLSLENKGKTLLQTFQEEKGNNWFEIYL